MQQVLIFLVDTFFSLLFFVFLLRFLMQVTSAGFRNPLAQAVLQATNWLIMPLRKFLPPIRRIDTASVVAIFLVALALVAAERFVRGGVLPDAFSWVSVVLLEILIRVLWLYFWAIFVYALVSMIAPGAYSPVNSLLQLLCEPILKPIRSVVPALGGLDLSPLIAGVIIQVILILLR